MVGGSTNPISDEIKNREIQKKLSDLHKKILITGAGGFIGQDYSILKKRITKFLELILIF